jgi:hypothetical protein
MTDYLIPAAEPKQIDEERSMELRVLSTNAGLKGAPAGEEQCENCVYYLENTADLSVPVVGADPGRIGTRPPDSATSSSVTP